MRAFAGSSGRVLQGQHANGTQFLVCLWIKQLASDSTLSSSRSFSAHDLSTSGEHSFSDPTGLKSTASASGRGAPEGLQHVRYMAVMEPVDQITARATLSKTGDAIVACDAAMQQLLGSPAATALPLALHLAIPSLRLPPVAATLVCLSAF